ncbi:hypothetical protein [Pelagerythrobacter sp.]|uniref:hypothetical protein n=1 Tax=Pelagerythrobacter sp. TaxID=2800702 RepID=UPI0035AEE832
MTLSPALLRFRLVAAVLLAVACLQAATPDSFGIERRHGSAFALSTVEVATAPGQRKADHGQVVPLDPPVPPAIPREAPTHVAAASTGNTAAALPPQTGPPRLPAVTSLTLAPRAPPRA